MGNHSDHLHEHDHVHSHTHDHGHAHGHSHSHAPSLNSERARKRVLLVIFITATYMIVEFVGGWISNSLALLGDATHMLTDVGALTLTYISFRISKLAPTRTNTFGYHRAEILGAFLNGLFLTGIAIYIIIEAVTRIHSPEAVDAVSMLWISAFGLLINIVVGTILMRSSHDNLAMKGALLHVLGDALGSVGAIIAALLIWNYGWTLADPIASIFVSIIILLTALPFIRDTVHVLLQGTPRHLRLEHLTEALRGTEGVASIHDIHLWTLTPGRLVLTFHAVPVSGHPHSELIRALNHVSRERFGIYHVTIQIEETDCKDGCDSP